MIWRLYRSRPKEEFNLYIDGVGWVPATNLIQAESFISIFFSFFQALKEYPEEVIQQQQQQQPMSHKKRVSFQQQQQQLLETEGGDGGVIASVDGLPSPAGKSSTGPVVVGGSTGSASSSDSSSSSSRYQPPSRDQVATILRLTNPVQLQRHLLHALLDNQVKNISAFLLILFLF
jgi:hypothetical protein